MKFVIKLLAIAKNPPSILIVGGILLIILSETGLDGFLFLVGLILIVAGILLHLYYLQLKNPKRKR